MKNIGRVRGFSGQTPFQDWILNQDHLWIGDWGGVYRISEMSESHLRRSVDVLIRYHLNRFEPDECPLFLELLDELILRNATSLYEVMERGVRAAHG